MPAKRKRDNSNEPPSDAESETSSPQDDPNTLRAAKDRECPFCHQAFTSSSLGRHLDLYIRALNPKRPDGIHNVDEIRRIRGGITRRQPKGSGKINKDRELPREQQQQQQSVQEVRSDTGETEERRSGHVTRELPRPTHFVNGMDWRTTGVINDVRPTSFINHRGIDNMNGKTPGPQLPPLATRSPIARQHDDAIDEQIETGKAAELALREVLDSLAAAKKEHEHSVIFDGVDLFTLTFPALCLTVLRPPRTLFSTRPFADPDSFGLQPPSQREKQALLSDLDRRNISRGVQEHVEAAYQQWDQLNEQDKMTTWIMEVLRAHSKAMSATDELRTQLSLSQQRIAHLESEYELLSRCQLPRERLLNPPATLPITKSTLDHFGLEGSPEALIDKWRTAVRTVARPKKPITSALTTRTTTYTDSVMRNKDLSNGKEPGTMELSADMIMHGAVFGVEGPISRVGQFARASHDDALPYKPITEKPAMSTGDHG